MMGKGGGEIGGYLDGNFCSYPNELRGFRSV